MEEVSNLKLQFVPSNLRNKIAHEGIRHLSYVIIEQEIMMLLVLLKSDIADKANAHQ